MHRFSQLHSWRHITNKQFNCAPPLDDLMATFIESLLSVYYQSTIKQIGIANDPGGICVQTFGVDESVSSGLSNAHILAVLQAL
jgi:hypothetical protein